MRPEPQVARPDRGYLRQQPFLGVDVEQLVDDVEAAVRGVVDPADHQVVHLQQPPGAEADGLRVGRAVHHVRLVHRVEEPRAVQVAGHDLGHAGNGRVPGGAPLEGHHSDRQLAGVSLDDLDLELGLGGRGKAQQGQC